MAKKQAFEFFFNQLVKGYRSIMGKDPEGLDLIKIKQEARQKLIDQDKVIEVQFGKPFSEEISIMDQINKSKNKIEGASNKIDEIMKEQADMYRPKTDAEIAAKYDKENKESIQKFKDKMKKDEPDDMATGGRAGYYTGGITDVEPNLSDIGHGSDSLMSRTRLMSPGSQATTSTGLNYLLAEDNDNLRVPFSKGKIAKEVLDKGRRGFMKAAGAAGAGIAALKTGLLGFGEKAAPVVEKVAETVSETAQGVPPYFFKLVEKIKTMGDDVTPNYATKDREVVKKYKDFEMTEDVSTGEITIQRQKPSDFEYYDEMLYEDVYMSYKPGKGQMDETMKGKTPLDEYTEDTSYIRTSGPQKGDIYNTVDGVPDDVLEEAGEKIIEKEIKSSPLDKADGGRIGFSKGKVAKKIIEFFGGLKKSKKLNDDEYQEFLDEVGGADQLEAYNFDGTVGDAQRIVKEQKEYMDDMFLEYKKGNLDPVAGDKSPARKKFLQNKLDEMEMSGDKRLMTTDEIEELSSFDLGSEMDVAKSLAPKMVERLQLKQKYPGITDDLLDKILIDDNVQRKAEVMATMDEALKMMEKGKGSDEIIETFKNVTRTKQAAGGLIAMLGE